MNDPVPFHTFASFKRYEMPEGFSIRLVFLGTGQEFLIIEEDCPALFTMTDRVINHAHTLPITFNTPEKYYRIDFINGGVLKLIEFSGRRALYSPQITFITVDALTHIDNSYTWEQLINEAKKEANKKETGQKA